YRLSFLGAGRGGSRLIDKLAGGCPARAAPLRGVLFALLLVARRLVGRYPIDALEPAAEIDIGTAFRAERSVGRRRGFAADRAGATRRLWCFVLVHHPS